MSPTHVPEEGLPRMDPEKFKEACRRGDVVPLETGEPNWAPPKRGAPAVYPAAPRMTVAEQEAALGEHLSEGWAWIDDLLNDPCRRAAVERLARSRHRWGAGEYGDAKWHEHPDRLMVEMMEELADFLVYASMRAHARRGGPGSR